MKTTISKVCKCGRHMHAESTMCSACHRSGPGSVFNHQAIWRATRNQDIAAIEDCPKRAAAIDAILAKRKACAE